MVDFILGLMLAALAVRGWIRGLVREVLNLVSLVAGLWIAFRLSKPFGDYLTQSFGVTPEVARIGAGIGLFILFGVTMSIAAHFLSKVMNLPGLSMVNRVGGAAVAFAWGVFLVLVFLNIARVIPLPSGVDQALDESSVGEAIAGEDAYPQTMFEGLIGDRAITALAAIQDLFGASRVVPGQGEELDIPTALLGELDVDREGAVEVLNALNEHRTGLGLDPFQPSAPMTELAESLASDAYTLGKLALLDGCLSRLRSVDVLAVSCDDAIALASTTLGALDAMLESESGAPVLESGEFDRVGIAVVEGPTGRILLVIAAG